MVYPPEAATFRAGRQRHHRQRRALRRDERRGLRPRPRRRALRGPQQRRARGRRRRRRSRLRVHDRRPRRRARPDRPQLRRRHERRHRLRLRRRRQFRPPLQPRHGGSRDARRATRTSQLVPRPDRGTRALHGQRARAADLLDDWADDAPAVRQGHAARLQAGAARPKRARGRRTANRRSRSSSGSPMGKITGFHRDPAGQAEDTARRRSASATGRRSTCPIAEHGPARARAPAAWTAAFRSATRAVRSAT